MAERAVGYVGDAAAGAADAEGFTLGRPAVVCRWRLAGSALPLENRHLRALSARTPLGAPVSRQLVAWARQHIEWTLAPGSSAHPDGVLMLVVDEEGRAAMSCGPYAPLRARTARALARRALESRREADDLGVAPETLWVRRGERLVAGIGAGERPSGACGLVCDLAGTLGIPVERAADLALPVERGSRAFDEAFLVSDEHGVVPARDASGEVSARIAASYDRLLERTREQARRRR